MILCVQQDNSQDHIKVGGLVSSAGLQQRSMKMSGFQIHLRIQNQGNYAQVGGSSSHLGEVLFCSGELGCSRRFLKQTRLNQAAVTPVGCLFVVPGRNLQVSGSPAAEGTGWGGRIQAAHYNEL